MAAIKEKKTIWPQGDGSRADTGREGQKVVCTSFCCSKHRADTKKLKEIFKKNKKPMSGAGEIQYEGSGADNNSHRQQQEEERWVFVYIFFCFIGSWVDSLWHDMRLPPHLRPSNQCIAASLASPGSRAHHRLSEKIIVDVWRLYLRRRGKNSGKKRSNLRVQSHLPVTSDILQLIF